jgi:hypothetical protein
VDLTVDAVPWWYVAALAGGFTVLGVLITWLTSMISEAVKARRERRQRWDERVIDHATNAATYASDFDQDIKAANDRFADEIRRAERLRANGEDPGMLSQYSTDYASYASLKRECMALELIADRRIRAAAQRLSTQALITRTAWGFPKVGGESHAERMRPLRSAVENFQSVVREYVGV